jgi:hypothetical protein
LNAFNWESFKRTKDEAHFDLYYGTSNMLGFSMIGSNKLAFGLDFSLYLGEKGIGKDYSKVFGPNAYAKDIYDIRTTPTFSFGFILGRKIFPNFLLYSKFGISGQQKYYNGYDSQQILSPSGYWYVSENKGISPLLGLGLIMNYDKFNLLVGYDNFNKLNLGFGLTIK